MLLQEVKRDNEKAALMGYGNCVMAWPSAGATRSRVIEGNLEADGECKRFGGQASKSIRWMPWHQEAMKDVVKLR